MGADLAALGIAQFMLKRFGQRLHAGLGDIIGRVAGRRGDALLGAGVDDDRRLAMRKQRLAEDARAVNDAAEIDVEHPLPVLKRTEERRTRLDAGIVHDDMDGPKRFVAASTSASRSSRLATSVATERTAPPPALLRRGPLRRLLADARRQDPPGRH